MSAEVKSEKRPSRPEVSQRGFNSLVVPSNVSDPVTCFDVDIEAGYLVTGTAAGRVYCWRIDHILPDEGACSVAVTSIRFCPQTHHALYRCF